MIDKEQLGPCKQADAFNILFGRVEKENSITRLPLVVVVVVM